MAKGKKKDKFNAILAVVLCLPLVFIAVFLINHFTRSISLEDINSVTVKISDDVSYTFDKNEDVMFFVDLLSGCSPINSAMRDVSNEKSVYIICSDGDYSYEYEFYPSLDLSGCLLVDSKGSLYVPAAESAKELLLRNEFDFLYADLFLPNLSVISGNNSYTVSPVESEWSYYKADGEIYSYSPEKLSDGSEVFMITKGLENTLSFAPDDTKLPYELLDIKYVSQSGTEYNIQNISELDLSFDTLLDVSFTAKWGSLNGAKAFGEAKYKFKIRYDIPSVIEIPVKDYTIGDVIKIDATHLNEDEKVELVTLLDTKGIDFDVLSEGKGIALIPVGLTNAAGKYPVELVTVTGSVKEDIQINALERGNFVSLPNIDETQYNDMMSLDKMTELETKLASITAKRPELNYFVFGEDNLSAPVTSKNILHQYGQQVNIKAYSNNDVGNRVCKGIVYGLEAGSQVRSAQAGEVVFSGTLAPTGNTVVVYHGYGIYTYYYHLDSLDVVLGDIVNKGQVVGKAGSTGYTNEKTVLHYAVSIDGIFVNPETFN